MLVAVDGRVYDSSKVPVLLILDTEEKDRVTNMFVVKCMSAPNTFSLAEVKQAMSELKKLAGIDHCWFYLTNSKRVDADTT